MQKFLLTSDGFSHAEISNEFLRLVRKLPENLAVIFIPTASMTEEERGYVEKSREELLGIGVKREHIKDLELDHLVSLEEIRESDVIYVCGGNTFYLLHKARESGFDKVLERYNGVYVGVSAGSILVGPNIEVSGPWDENVVGMKDTIGFNMISFALVPHYQRKDKAIVEDLKQKADYEIRTITDGQAVVVENGEARIIGEE